MSPRITANLTAEGVFEIRMNEEGRDLLVRELQMLSKKNDHFHLGSYEGSQIQISANAYQATDTILHTGKVYFRPDEWDRIYFPHVMDESQ